MKLYITLLLFLIASFPLLAQDSFQTFDGSTNNTGISSATIALGTNGTGTGSWGGCTSTGADFFHSQAFQMPFPGLQAAAGTKFSGGGTTGLQYTLRSASPYPACSYSGFSATTSVAAAFMFNANFDSTGNSSQQESNLEIIYGGGTEYMILLHINGLLKLETKGNGVSFTSSGVTYHGNKPVFVSMLYKVGSPFTMSIYDSTCTLIGSQQVSTATPVNNPGLVIVGITGGESEPSGGGNAIGWDNVIVKEGATSEIACGDTTRLSSGVIAPTRSADWTVAGVTGGIPDASWTQCGSTITPPSSSVAINAAIAACSANTYVLLGPGTFTLNSQLVHSTKNVALRGSGANSTFLVKNFSGSSFISVPGSTSYTSFVEWTNGYAQGATKIKVASVPSGVVAGSIVRLDQAETGFTGDTPTGTSLDNGQLFDCSVQWASPNGCSVNGPSSTPDSFRWQREWHIVSAVNGTTITLQDPLLAANWNPGQTPHAQFLTSPLSNIGIENLSLDATGQGASAQSEINVVGARDSWITGVRVINSQQYAIGYSDSDHLTVQSNYAAFSQTASPAVHGFARANFGHTLTANNIVQGFPEGIHNEQAMAGNVEAYNYIVNMFNNTDLMGDCYRLHGDGGTFNLWEGNICNRIWEDVAHGINRVNTRYRNFITSWESCANGQCGTHTKDSNTNAEAIDAFGRYDNLIGEVVGTPGFSTAYKSTSGGNGVEFSIGTANGTTPPADSLAISTGLFWGNYDVFTGTVRWCGQVGNTGFGTTCSNTSEVPTGALLYANPVPTKGDTGGALPASFAFSSVPTFFQALAFPPIGPNITSGNIGQCSGSLNVAGQFNGLPALTNANCGGHGLTTSAWGGHVNAIPAMVCFLNVMGGVPDGTGSPLPFDANSCYATSSQAAAPTFSPPAGSYTTPQTITISSVTSGVTICVTNDGTLPTTNGAGTCINGTALSNGGTVSVIFTQLLQAIATKSGLTDSTISSAQYTFPTSPVIGTFAGNLISNGTALTQ